MEYKLRENPRARRINITVRRDGTVWVTKPRRVAMREVDRFIRKCEQWILKAQEKYSKLPKTTRVESPKRQFDQFKRMAHLEISRRVSRLNTHYRCRPTKIVVRNQRARWGSCSPKGVLSFNYRLIFLPDRLADYVVAHELCHLREMNHSRRFWKLVAETVPDHAKCRKELRELERGLL